MVSASMTDAHTVTFFGLFSGAGRGRGGRERERERERERTPNIHAGTDLWVRKRPQSVMEFPAGGVSKLCGSERPGPGGPGVGWG